MSQRQIGLVLRIDYHTVRHDLSNSGENPPDRAAEIIEAVEQKLNVMNRPL
jgi:hypothetical protein